VDHERDASWFKLDETIRGHVSCSFLALVLKKELEDRIAAMSKDAAEGDATASGSWPDILAGLDALTETETEVEQDGKRFLLRSAPRRAPSPRFARRRGRPAAHRAPARRRLTPFKAPKCSAKALFQRRFAFVVRRLGIEGVEDQLDTTFGCVKMTADDYNKFVCVYEPRIGSVVDLSAIPPDLSVLGRRCKINLR
jgi:hypothetical protein